MGSLRDDILLQLNGIYDAIIIKPNNEDILNNLQNRLMDVYYQISNIPMFDHNDFMYCVFRALCLSEQITLLRSKNNYGVGNLEFITYYEKFLNISNQRIEKWFSSILK